MIETQKFDNPSANDTVVTLESKASIDTRRRESVGEEGKEIGSGNEAFVIGNASTGGVSLIQKNPSSDTGGHIYGATTGIKATSSLGGDIRIVTTGTVKGFGGKDGTGAGTAGILANTSDGGGGVTISATAAVIGKYRGVSAHAASGDLSISISGDVGGIGGGSDSEKYAEDGVTKTAHTTDTAIHAVAAGTGTGNLTITAAAVRGGRYGIWAVGSGTGSVSIAASGTVSVQGPSSRGGIYAAQTHADGASLTVAVATVTSSGGFGIKAIGSGAGAVLISARPARCRAETETASGRAERDPRCRSSWDPAPAPPSRARQSRAAPAPAPAVMESTPSRPMPGR